MTPERWQQVQELFDAALAVEPDGRTEFLRRTVRDDELRAEVETLLAALDAEQDRFEQPAATRFLARAAQDHAADTASMVGRRVGRYVLLREIGEGGMGTVYEAVRGDDEYHKRVAVKLIKRGMDSVLVVRRFRQERQILAGLQHPNIAALLDGGLTDDGQPYFVLEFVEGRSLTEYCAGANLSVRERLELFLQLCASVHYAHQNLVIHRDLKAGNILVTDEGVPKLLDFGVAKLLRADDERGATLTQAGFHAFTPEYASPEVIRGEAVTTAADIYSLGVILYELLTGQRPFRFAHRSIHEVVHIVGSMEPTRPSVAVSGSRTRRAARPSVAGGLRRELAGELDSIVLKAIAREPGRRYSSAEALADDVRRFLDGRPVLARQATWSYRTRKFIGRNRGPVAAGTLLVLSLLAGGVATVWQARRADAERLLAEQRAREVRELASSLMFEAHDAIALLPGATAARATLVGLSLNYLDRLYSEAGDDAELQHELAQAYLRLGTVQGDPNHPNLGDLTGARASMDRALGLASSLARANPTDTRARTTLAVIQEKKGDVEAWTGNVADGVRYMQAALATRRALADADPLRTETALRVAISRIKLADLLGHPTFPNLGRRDASMAQYDSALALLRALHPDSAARPDVRRYVGTLHERRGRVFEEDHHYDAALVELEASRAIRELLAMEAPGNAHVQRDAGVARERLCSLHLRRGDPPRALQHCHAALAVYRRLAAIDPADAESRATVAIGQRWLALALLHNRQPDDALEQLEQSAAALQALVDSDSANTNFRRQLGRTLLRTSIVHAQLARSTASPDRAREHRRRAADTLQRGSAHIASEESALSDSDRDLIEQASRSAPTGR